MIELNNNLPAQTPAVGPTPAPELVSTPIEQLWTVKQVAQYMQVCLKTVYNQRQNNGLPSVLVGGAVRGEWILRGGPRQTARQTSFRFYIAICCVAPQLLPCKHPNLSWCARVHGYSRKWSSRLGKQFAREFGEHVQFRGQRFRCRSQGK